jgi:hypothetical protein
MVPDDVRFLISPEFRQKAVALSAARKRNHCEVRAARCLNRCCGCCGTHPGDAVCATNTHVLDDDLHRAPRGGGRGCLGAVVTERRRSVADNMAGRFLPFFRTWLRPVSAKLARRVLVYLVTGDVELAYHALRHEENLMSFPHVEHLLREVERMHGAPCGENGAPRGGAAQVPERERWRASLRRTRVIL